MNTIHTQTVNLIVNESINLWQDKNQLTLVITEIESDTLEIIGIEPLELLSALKYYFKNLNLEEVTNVELYTQHLRDIQLVLNDKLNSLE
jgi:hypothetical protein